MTHPSRFEIAPDRHRKLFGGLSSRAITLSVLLGALFSGCKAECPRGLVLQGGHCHEQDASVDGGDDPAAGAGEESANATGTKALMQSTSAAGAGGPSKLTAPAVDPTIEWMCMKSATGECTSCKQDNDCPKHVCEQGFCMDCREASQCAAAESCISNRCVPERKPSSIWQVSGGGETRGPDIKALVTIGTPSPAGYATTSGYKLNIAPGTGLY
jgi:hypothetical protein